MLVLKTEVSHMPEPQPPATWTAEGLLEGCADAHRSPVAIDPGARQREGNAASVPNQPWIGEKRGGYRSKTLAEGLLFIRPAE
jgi:hypothetical protein